MDSPNLLFTKLYKEELLQFEQNHYSLAIQKPKLGKPTPNKVIENYKSLFSPDLYNDLQQLYSSVNEIQFSWSIKKRVNDEKLLQQQWIRQELIQEQGLSLDLMEEYLGGVLNISSLEVMMTDQFYTNLFNEEGVEYLPLDRHWTRVACLKKQNGLIENKVYFFESEDRQKVYDLNVGVLEYIQLAYTAKCFYNWQYAFLFQKKGSFANDHLRIMLPNILPHIELDLSKFGIDLKTDVPTKDLSLETPKIKTYTDFPEEEERLTRYLMSIDKDVFCTGSTQNYHVTFNSSFPSIDFTPFSALALKLKSEDKTLIPRITLENIPDQCNLSSLEKLDNIDAIHLKFVGKEFTNLDYWKNKSLPSIKTLWLSNLKNLQNTDFLHAFQGLLNLKLLSLKNCQISKDWTFFNSLKSLTIRGTKPFGSPITALFLPETTLSLTLSMDNLLSIPNIHNKALQYLEVRSKGISKIENLAALHQLKILKLDHCSITKVEAIPSLPNLKSLSFRDNKVLDFSALANLPKGTMVWLSKSEFVTGDRKTDLKRRLKLKHLDLKLS